MKKSTIALTFLLGLAISSDAQTAALVSTFDIPPFEEEATVNGIDGWKMVSSGKTDMAIVRMHGGNAPGLLLRTHGIEKRLDEEWGGEVTITVVVQFGRISEKGSNSAFTFMPILGVNLGGASFGFSDRDGSSDEPGGIFYFEKSIDDEGNALNTARILFPREEIIDSAKYTLTMDMDVSSRTFVLTVSGTGINGEPFEVKSDEIAMDPPDRFPPNEILLRGIRLASSLPARTELYVESITIAPQAH